MDGKELMGIALQELEKKSEPIQSSPESSKPPAFEAERIEKLIKDIPNVMARYGVPPRFVRPDLQLPESLAEFVGSMGQIDRGLCLLGGPGVGKTMSMALLIQESLKRRAAAFPGNFWGPQTKSRWRFIVYPEFIMEVQDSFKNERGELTALEMLKDVAQTPLLVIDDLGAEKPTEYVRQATYYIINHREMHMLPTFVTSNFSIDHLDENIDPRISSRIAGLCEIIRVDGRDRRLRDRRLDK